MGRLRNGLYRGGLNCYRNSRSHVIAVFLSMHVTKWGPIIAASFRLGHFLYGVWSHPVPVHHDRKGWLPWAIKEDYRNLLQWSHWLGYVSPWYDAMAIWHHSVSVPGGSMPAASSVPMCFQYALKCVRTYNVRKCLCIGALSSSLRHSLVIGCKYHEL